MPFSDIKSIFVCESEISPKFRKNTKFREIPQNFADISRNFVWRNSLSTLTAGAAGAASKFLLGAGAEAKAA
jgi:hypothetical protein